MDEGATKRGRATESRKRRVRQIIGQASRTMADKSDHTDSIRFDVYEMDLSSRELRKSGKLVRLQPQPFRVLGMLAGRAGEVVTRAQLRDEIWGKGTFVDF